MYCVTPDHLREWSWGRGVWVGIIHANPRLLLAWWCYYKFDKKPNVCVNSKEFLYTNKYTLKFIISLKDIGFECTEYSFMLK